MSRILAEEMPYIEQAPGRSRGMEERGDNGLVYDKAERDTMLRVVTERGTLREEVGS